MTEFHPSLPVVQKSDSTEEPKVTTALQELETLLNGKIDKTNLVAAIPRAEAANKYEEKVFTKAEATAGVEVSATRPAIVTIESTEATVAFEVGGKKAGNLKLNTGITTMVFAGEVWKAATAATAWWRLL